MGKKARDQNGNDVTSRVRRVRHEETGVEGWAATCWFGGAGSPATNIRRHVYKTKAAAEAADVSDDYSNSSMLSFGDGSADHWFEQST